MNKIAKFLWTKERFHFQNIECNSAEYESTLICEFKIYNRIKYKFKFEGELQRYILKRVEKCYNDQIPVKCPYTTMLKYKLYFE